MTSPFAGIIPSDDGAEDSPFAGIVDQPLAEPKTGAVGGFKSAVVGAAKAVKEAYYDPTVISRGFNDAVAGLGQLGESAITHPINTAKAIVVDGIIKPLLINPVALAWDTHAKYWLGPEYEGMSDEERFDKAKESTANYAGLATGYGIGKALALGGTVAELKNLAKVGSVEELSKGLSGLPAATLVKVHEIASQPQFAATVVKGVTEGLGAGAVTGLMTGNTPEERFGNAFNYGIAGALIGTALEGALGRGARAKVRAIGESAQALASIKSAEAIRSLPAANQVKAAADLLEGVPIDEILMRHTPPGQSIILDNLPSVTGGKNSVVHKAANGTYSVLIDGRYTELSALSMDELGEQLQTSMRKGTILESFKEKANANPEDTAMGKLVEDTNTDFETVHKPKIDAIFDELARRKPEDLTVPNSTVDVMKRIKALNLMDRVRAEAENSATADRNANLEAAGHTPERIESYHVENAARTVLKDYYDKRIANAAPTLTPEQIAGFKAHGFIPNEIVTVNGAEHILLSKTKNRFEVQNMTTGEIKYVKRQSIVRGEKLETGYVKDNVLPANAEGSIPTTYVARESIGVRRGFGAMIDDIKSTLSDKELEIVNANRDKMALDDEAITMTLGQKATTSGYALKHVDGGAVEVIDAESGTTVATLKTADDAAKFIENSGKRIGNVSLRIDGPARGSGVPPNAPISNDHAPIEYSKARTPEKIRAIVTLTTHLIQPMREPMLAMETLWKDSGMYTRVFRPLQDAYMKFNANRQPWLNSLSKISEVMANLTPDERAQIFDYIETMTPAQVKVGLIRNRHLSVAEIRVAEGMAAALKSEQGAGSITRAFDWLAARRDMSEKAFAAYEKVNVLSDVEKHAAMIFDQLKKTDVGETSVYAVSRLARAILLDTPDRATFAKLNNMKPAALASARMLEDWFTTLGPEVGIDAKQMLNGYISHLRNVDQSLRNAKALSQFNGEGATDFYASLTRTGEINSLVRDPIEIALKYLSSGMRAKFLSRDVNMARAALKDGARTIANDKTTGSSAAAVKAQKLGSDYIDQLVGQVDGHDAMVQAAFDKFLDRVTPTTSNAARGTFANAWIRSVEFAAQGMKPLAGIRDLTTFLQIFGTRFGFTRMGRALDIFHTAMQHKDLLQLFGEIPGLTAQYTESAADAAARQSLTTIGKAGSAVSAAAKKVSDLGFTASLQPNVYALSHAFVFLESWDHIGKAVTEFVQSKGKIKLSAFEDRIALDTYGTPIKNQFRELMNNGQYSKAINFLAKVTGEETVGYYGMANHPALMRSRVGKVIGQFGQWPMWYMNVFGRMITQGSPGRIAGASVRFGALIGALNAAQAVTGFNLRNWQANPQQALNVFEGSPTWQAIRTTAAALGTTNDYMHDIAVNELARQVDLTQPTIGVIPKPLFIYNGVEGVQRMINGDPLHIVGWKLLGGGLDSEQYPKP